jgi:uncharacterized protein YbjT (DUF2867 family)
MKHIALVGATGLTGGFLLDLLLNSSGVSKVSVFARSDAPFIHHKLEWHKVDLLDESTWVDSINIPIHLAFCCIGTTKAQTPNKQLYKAIDFGIPVAFARFVHRLGCRDFAVISSVGADSNSRIFYSKTKGEMEDELGKLNFNRLFIFRPSLIEGKRKSTRIGEKIASVLMHTLGLFIPNHYKPITGQKLASVMWDFVQEKNKEGIYLIDSKQIYNRKISLFT